MNLDSAAKQLEIVLGEAMTTAECDWTSAFAMADAGNFLLSASDGTTNGTTAVVVVAAPPGGQWRQVKEVTFFNKDTVTHELTLRVNNGGAMRIIARRSIPPDGDFRYVSDLGVAASASAPALLVESGSAAKISALPAFDLAAPPTGAELFPAVEGGATVQLTLAQLYTLFAAWLDYVATSPLDAPTTTSNGLGVDIAAGSGGATSGNGGSFQFSGGAAQGTGNGGGFALVAGDGGATAGNGANVSLRAGNAANGDGGDIRLTLGVSAGGGVNGNILVTGLPTSDPGVSGALWVSAGVLQVSP